MFKLNIFVFKGEKDKGTQIKLVLTFKDGMQAMVKPMRLVFFFQKNKI